MTKAEERRGVHEVATSYSGNLLACAIGVTGLVKTTDKFESRISIWDFIASKKLCEFDSCMDLGGERLAISNDGTSCAVGAYTRLGIVMHRTKDGSILWQRRDLKSVQEILFDPLGAIFIALIDRRGAHILNPRSGETIRAVRGANVFIISPYQAMELVTTKKKCILVDSIAERSIRDLDIQGEMIGIRYERGSHERVPPLERRKVKRLNVLHAVFGQEIVFVSEMGGPLSAFYIKDGALLWRYPCPPGSHFLRLGFTEATNALWGFLFYYRGPDAQKQTLVAFDPKSGSVLSNATVNGFFGCRFALRGKVVVTNTGDIYDLTDSRKPKIIAHLDFP